MKRKIITSLTLLLLIFGVGGVIASVYVTRSTSELEGLVRLHRIENLRRALVIHVQTVQSDLYTVNTPFAKKLDSIVANVTDLTASADDCLSCHHPGPLAEDLREIRSLIDEYQTALSYYITARANRARIQRIEEEAAVIGERLLERAEQMSTAASERLVDMTREATRKINDVRLILLATLVVALVLGVGVSIRLTRAVTRPVQDLVEGTRALAEGALGHTIRYEGSIEFRKLADNFNRMSGALKEGYDQLQRVNADLEAEVQERRRVEDELRLNQVRLKALLELSEMTEAPAREIADFVLEKGVSLTESEIGFLGFFHDGGRTLTQHTLSAGAGRECRVSAGVGHVSVEEGGVWAEAVRRRAPVLINDFEGSSLKRGGVPAGHPPVSRLLCIPLLEADRVEGVLVVANKGRNYDQGDAHQLTLLLQGMAQHVRRRKMDDEFLRTQKLESIGVLAGGLAHDFNNLLTGILANVSLAASQAAPGSPLRERLRQVEEASQRATRLTQQLLTFSKGGAPVRQSVSVPKLVQDAAEFALSGARASSECRLPDDLWPALADPGQIFQLVSNVAINADQAMPGGGKLRIRGENLRLGPDNRFHLEPGRYVKISFADTGCGILREHLAKVFDPYFTTKATGTGLGLTTSYSIARRHGGHLEMDSQVGKGTTVHLLLPAAEGLPAAAAERAAKEHHGQGQGRAAGRVLVMDDDDLVRDAAVEILREAGYRVEEAPDGAAAVAICRAAKEAGDPIGVAVMDLTVPGGVGGVDALRQIREFDPEVRAIVSSGYSNDPVMADFESYGFRDCVVKPYRIDALIETVARLS